MFNGVQGGAQQRVCRNFLNGHCAYGDRCSFQHVRGQFNRPRGRGDYGMGGYGNNGGGGFSPNGEVSTTVETVASMEVFDPFQNCF